MAGIYLHIPFCRQACSYCDFHFSTNRSRQDDMVRAIMAEARLHADFFGPDSTIETIYFGGGTPSLLTGQQIREILSTLHDTFRISEDVEITLEANPDDLEHAHLQAMREAGINRLSIGVQSFSETDLLSMRRSHNATQAGDAIRDAQAAGFDNISVDLIYGIPGSSMEQWKANVQQALDLGPQHLSAYALTVEPQTLLHDQVGKGFVTLPEDAAYHQQFFHLIDALEAAGWEHYELSNFASPGFRSRHNSSYWKGVPYLGLGPSAHSYRNPVRSWNLRNNALYLRSIGDGGKGLRESETLSPRDRLNEYMMTHFRKAEGVDLDRLQNEWGFDLMAGERDALNEFQRNGWMAREGNMLVLSREGKMMSDAIIRELFQVD